VNGALVETRQITVPLLRSHDATDIFLSRSIPGGYGWLFPKGARANLGAGVAPAHRSKLKAIVDTLHAEQTKAGRVGAAVLATTGGAIPVGGMLQASGILGDTQVLLAGDAAGLANPVTGAGIAAAVFSGGLAGEAAGSLLGGSGSAAEDYDDELQSVLGASITRALQRRRELADALARGAGHRSLRRGWIAFPEYWAA
jgi:flavin-dependent dehydrogenase